MALHVLEHVTHNTVHDGGSISFAALRAMTRGIIDTFTMTFQIR